MELLERVVELSLAGYCCSQVMALLLLELLGEEDDGFVRAMGGLINGGGRCISKPCGKTHFLHAVAQSRLDCIKQVLILLLLLFHCLFLILGCGTASRELHASNVPD